MVRLAVNPFERLDVLVVGSGVAGLSAAVRLAELGGARVGVLTKGELEQSTTRWAQGGIAAVLPGDEDSTDLHLADTLRAGAGLCDQAAVRVLVDEGSERVHELIALGAVFDRGPGGHLSRAREGGHSTARVLHAGGTATGAEVERALVEAVRDSAAAILEDWFALDLVGDGVRCTGVAALDPAGGLQRVEASHVVLACGGAGQMYAVTTNPVEATGDGIAMALRAGVPVADVEFVQFHPTALHHAAMPRPLISEALRGHGAVLRDGAGNRFVDELLPRDLVSRAIAVKLAEEGSEHVWLDATGLEDFGRRFPTIAETLQEAGFDPTHDWLPVAPAAHYLSGGVLVDLDGATALPGLWAAGEVACSGVHGANRLASNSLLEGMVFGARCVDAILSGRDGPGPTGALAGLGSGPGEARPGVSHSGPIAVRPVSDCRCGAELPRAPSRTVAASPASDAATQRAALQAAMTNWAGVVRDASSLARALAAVNGVPAGLGPTLDRATAEVRNLTDVSRALLEAATEREETRGSQARSDFPETSSDFLCRLSHGARHGVQPGDQNRHESAVSAP
ncbi:MAG: L-aspartate oxidase [Acidimicrobiales bacterium]